MAELIQSGVHNMWFFNRRKPSINDQIEAMKQERRKVVRQVTQSSRQIEKKLEENSTGFVIYMAMRGERHGR